MNQEEHRNGPILIIERNGQQERANVSPLSTFILYFIDFSIESLNKVQHDHN